MGAQMAKRNFLFLQGPHGPFFYRLGQRLRDAGAAVHKLGITTGDRAFWPERASFTPYRGSLEDWPAAFERLVADRGITDLALYGDTRPLHALAIGRARAVGLTVHVFEEGYLRPWWITYERGGANGHSPIMDMTLEEMRAALTAPRHDPVEPPAHWGDMREHIFYGAVTHGLSLLGRRGAIPPHREIGLGREGMLYVHRMIGTPAHIIARARATAKIKRAGYPYHLVLLQLDHDASFRHHGAFASQEAFLDHVIDGFAHGAPPHHHLVMKAHPLEDGRVPQARLIRRLARGHGVSERVHYVRGGKLAYLLDSARSAVTVNSTAAQQALWRGLPVRAFGRAVYNRPELTSVQPIADFFASPTPPDRAAYADFRQFLLETSQIPGGFYSARGRRQLYRQLVDLMLAPEARGGVEPLAAHPQHLRALP